MGGAGLTTSAIGREDTASWDRSDAWLAVVAELLEETADECRREPAVGMWMLRDGDLIVGTVGILRRRKTGRLELCRLHVRPQYRGRGLSRRLIFHALAHAHAHSDEWVTAQVREGNIPACRALAAFGFREMSRHIRDRHRKTILVLEETNELRQHDVYLNDGPLVLRPMTEDDWDVLLKWNNDPEVLYYAEGSDVTSRSLEETQVIFRSVSHKAFTFIVEVNEKPIGECWLQEMNLGRVLERYPEDMDLRRIDLTIGEKEFWNRGWGTRIIGLLVRFGFEECGADAIFGCDVADYNPRSRRAFEKNGFVMDGVIPQEPGGKAREVYDLKLTKRRYRELKGSK